MNKTIVLFNKGIDLCQTGIAYIKLRLNIQIV